MGVGGGRGRSSPWMQIERVAQLDRRLARDHWRRVCKARRPAAGTLMISIGSITGVYCGGGEEATATCSLQEHRNTYMH